MHLLDLLVLILDKFCNTDRPSLYDQLFKEPSNGAWGEFKY